MIPPAYSMIPPAYSMILGSSARAQALSLDAANSGSIGLIMHWLPHSKPAICVIRGKISIDQ